MTTYPGRRDHAAGLTNRPSERDKANQPSRRIRLAPKAGPW